MQPGDASTNLNTLRAGIRTLTHRLVAFRPEVSCIVARAHSAVGEFSGPSEIGDRISQSNRRNLAAIFVAGLPSSHALPRRSQGGLSRQIGSYAVPAKSPSKLRGRGPRAPDPSNLIVHRFSDHMGIRDGPNQDELHAVVLSCKRARKQMLDMLPAQKPTLH
jgi:hypothetical protein